MKVYTYVIATDAGSAPNYDPPCLTLAICKPKIRSTAEPGDLVLAFNGAALGRNPHGVRWAGIVAEKLSFTDYWHDQRFAGKKPGACSRPDNLYEPAGLDFRQVPNSVHGPTSKARDLGGRFVLTFEPWWYFGNTAPILPSEFRLRMENGRRAHRVHTLSDSDWDRLERWLKNQSTASPKAAPKTYIPPPPRAPRAGTRGC